MDPCARYHPNASRIEDGTIETLNVSAGRMEDHIEVARLSFNGSMAAKALEHQDLGKLLILEWIVSLKSSGQRSYAMLTLDTTAMLLVLDQACLEHSDLPIIDSLIRGSPRAHIVQFSFHRCPQTVHYRRKGASAIASFSHDYQTSDRDSYLVERRHGLIRTANLDLVERCLSVVAALSGTLHCAQLG